MALNLTTAHTPDDQTLGERHRYGIGASNDTTQIAGVTTTNCTYNVADQLTAVNGAGVTHDLNGSVTADETGGAYTWDVRGRLASLTRNGVSATFGYNQADLRVSKTVGGVQTTYLLDGDNVVRENKSGAITDLLQGPGTDDLLMRGGNWFTPRSLGSSSTITDSSGNWLQRYDYAPFGQVTVSVGAGAAQPFQFTGREADETGLMYYRARYYNPSWGRFVSEDPAGFRRGINAYVYCVNNTADTSPLRFRAAPPEHRPTAGSSGTGRPR